MARTARETGEPRPEEEVLLAADEPADDCVLSAELGRPPARPVDALPTRQLLAPDTSRAPVAGDSRAAPGTDAGSWAVVERTLPAEPGRRLPAEAGRALRLVALYSADSL